MMKWIKWIKRIGNLLTVAAIFFVLEKLFTQKVNVRELFALKNILPCLLVIVVQTLMVVSNVFPWKTLVTSLSGEKLTYGETVPVFVKSNLMKYIPGNVFQYAGRQELALDKKLPQLEVAFSTLMDILLNVLAASLISLLFLHDYIGNFLAKHVHSNGEMIYFSAAFLVILAVLIYLLRRKIKGLFTRYEHFFTRRTLGKIAQGLLYYILALSLSSLLFLLLMHSVVGASFSAQESVNLFSSYTLAWLVGFVVPGAPAGLGIKEAVMLEIVGKSLSAQAVILGMLVIRLLLTLADFLAYLAVLIYSRTRRI